MASLLRHPGFSPPQFSYPSLALGTTLGLTLAYLIRSPLFSSLPSSSSSSSSPSIIPAPLPPSPSSPTSQSHPYPPSILPGHRLFPTPWGKINIYEFGIPEGEKVLLLPGIGTPVLALGDLALRLSERGYRVMMFDYFGRGWSDAPLPLGGEYDMRLYTAQILAVLGSSELGWTGDDGFHMLGYSLGGGLAVEFARYFGPMVKSLVLVAGGGLIRRERHVGWRSRVLYSRGWLPEGLLEWLVRRRIRPAGRGGEGRGDGRGDADEVDHEGRGEGGGEDSDANGGKRWDSTLLSKRGDKTTVADVMEWQIEEHGGFVKAFMSTIRYAPMYDQRETWAELGEMLRVRREGKDVPGLKGGKVLMVLGRTDSVVIMEELVEDAKRVLGDEALEVVAIEAGHEVAFTHGEEVADAAIRFWTGE